MVTAIRQELQLIKHYKTTAYKLLNQESYKYVCQPNYTTICSSFPSDKIEIPPKLGKIGTQPAQREKAAAGMSIRTCSLKPIGSCKQTEATLHMHVATS